MYLFPFYKQYDSMQCGITCLQMICEYYNIKYSANFLSNLCYTTTEGMSMLSIRKAAIELGYECECGKINIIDIKYVQKPCILHWNQNHFVVLYKVKKNRFYIADPAKGLVKYNLEEFKKHWVSTQSDGEEKGIAMFLEPTPAFYEKKMDEEPKEERSFNMLICKCSANK